MYENSKNEHHRKTHYPSTNWLGSVQTIGQLNVKPCFSLNK